eukprot:SAG31_NODE_42432_length_271_cov_1.470930_2_plen_47_part_01
MVQCSPHFFFSYLLYKRETNRFIGVVQDAQIEIICDCCSGDFEGVDL